jgi:hypothetical protein
VPDPRLKWFEKFGNDCVALIQAEEARLAALQNGAPSMGAPEPAAPGAPPALAA